MTGCDWSCRQGRNCDPVQCGVPEGVEAYLAAFCCVAVVGSIAVCAVVFNIWASA